MQTDVVELLQKLVRIDSRNTRPLDSPGPRDSDEEAICAFLKDHLHCIGFQTAVQYAAPRRPQLMAWNSQNQAWPTLVFQAHMDTVGTDGMVIDPFAAELRDGRVYGRGACDTKGGMAAMLVAMERLQRLQLPLNLMFIGTCSEETGCEGAAQLDLGSWPIDGIIVGEPTSNQPVIAHKTNILFELIATGKAAHGARPEAGCNAVYRMLDVINCLRSEIIPQLAAHEAAGFNGSTLSLGMINGGTKVNIVPERCSAFMDLRLVPLTQKPMDVLEGILLQVRRVTGIDVELAWTHLSPGFSISRQHFLVKSLCDGLSESGVEPEVGTVSYCTDGGVFAERGCNVVVCGPGDILNAHGAEEYIEVAELQQAVEIFMNTAKKFAVRAKR